MAQTVRGYLRILPETGCFTSKVSPPAWRALPAAAGAGARQRGNVTNGGVKERAAARSRRLLRRQSVVLRREFDELRKHGHQWAIDVFLDVERRRIVERSDAKLCAANESDEAQP